MKKDLRKELTSEEKQKPYAKYFYKPIASPNAELIEILKRVPMDVEKALSPKDINHLIEESYDEVETGDCVLPNGTGYVE